MPDAPSFPVPEVPLPAMRAPLPEPWLKDDIAMESVTVTPTEAQAMGIPILARIDREDGTSVEQLDNGNTTGNAPWTDENPAVNHPIHYNKHPSGIECIEIVRYMGFNTGNVVKYLWRDGIKDTEVSMEDLEKALWYLQDEVDTRRAALESSE